MRYVQSEHFGGQSESKKIHDTIQVYVKKLVEQNHQLAVENAKLERENAKFDHILQYGDEEIKEREDFTAERGDNLSTFDYTFMKFKGVEKLTHERAKKMEMDQADLVAYVKWITNDLGKLRARVRIAEKIIADLKKSGEESVEQLLNNLFDMKRKEEELANEADNLRDIVASKQDLIERKEGEISRVKSFIERETAAKDAEIQDHSEEIDDQRACIAK